MKPAALAMALFASVPVSFADLISLRNGIDLNAPELAGTEIIRDDGRDDLTVTVRVKGLRDGQSIKQAALSCDVDEEMIEWKNDLLFLHFQGRDFDHPSFRSSIEQDCDVAITVESKDKTKPSLQVSTDFKLISKKSGYRPKGWHVISDDQRYQSLSKDANVTWDLHLGTDVVRQPNSRIPEGTLKTWLGECNLNALDGSDVCNMLGIRINVNETENRFVSITSQVKSADMEGMPMSLTLLIQNEGADNVQLTKPLTVDARPVTWMADNKARTVEGKPVRFELMAKDSALTIEQPIPELRENAGDPTDNNNNNNAPNQAEPPSLWSKSFDDGSLVIPMKMSTAFRLGFPNEFYGPSFDDVAKIKSERNTKGRSTSNTLWTAKVTRFCMGDLNADLTNFRQENNRTDGWYNWKNVMNDCLKNDYYFGNQEQMPNSLNYKNGSLWTEISKKKPVFMADDLFVGLTGQRKFTRSANVKIDERTELMNGLLMLDEITAIQKERIDKRAMILLELELKNKVKKKEDEKQAKSLIKLSLDTSMNIAWISFVDVKAGKNDGIPIAINGESYGFGKSSKIDTQKERNLNLMPTVKNMAPIDLVCYNKCPKYGEWRMYLKDLNQDRAKQATMETNKDRFRMAQLDKKHGFYLYQEWKEETNRLSLTRLSAHPSNAVEKTTLSVTWKSNDNENESEEENTVISWDISITQWNGERYFWTGLGCFFGIVFLQGLSCWIVSKRNPKAADN